MPFCPKKGQKGAKVGGADFANYLTTWLNYYANLYLEKFSFSQPIRSLISQIATFFEPCHFEFTYQDQQVCSSGDSSNF